LIETRASALINPWKQAALQGPTAYGLGRRLADHQRLRAIMSDLEIILRVAAVAALSSYLFFKHRQRVRSRYEPYAPAQWTGKAIDVTPLKPTVEDVRRDYLAARQPPSDMFHRRILLGLARHTVARLAY
jgi:hypothetical protein